MSSQPDPTNLPPGTFIQGWRVMEKLGQGSYGVVYHVELREQDFALKIAQHRADSGDTAHTDERIRRELACLSLVNHPNIVRVWGHGRWPDPRMGFFFIVEDRVDGYTLAGWAEATHPTFRQVVALMEIAADALEAAHKDRIFHRDLKPSNIMVRRSDNAPVITDFSVGDHPLAEDLTEGLPPGTRRYRSPEALRFEREHPHAPEVRYAFQVADELFALGATLYDILTDPLPTERRPRLPLNNDALPPPSPAKVNPRVPPALSDLTMALLDPNPRSRPPSSGALRRMLGELRADPAEAWDSLVYPPSARRTATPPVPKARQGLHWPGWRRATALGAALLAILLGAILVGSHGRDEAPHSAQVELPPQPPPPAPGVDLPAKPPTPRALPQRPLESASPPTQKENNAVSLSRSTPQASSPTSPKARVRPTLKQCAALVGMVAFLKAGCTTVHLRPEPGECPEEALKAMKEFRQPRDDGGGIVSIYIDAKHDEGGPDLVYANGPITGAIIQRYSPFPEGTLLEGHLWVSAPGDRLFGQYTRARLPDGSTIPICLELCDHNRVPGTKKKPAPSEGTALAQNGSYACWTDRWH